MPTGNKLIDNMTDEELKELRATTGRAIRERFGSGGDDDPDLSSVSDSEFAAQKNRIFRAQAARAKRQRVQREAREILDSEGGDDAA